MTTFTTEDRLNATRGAGEGREMSYQEIADELGVSKTMVMLMEKSALARLRKYYYGSITWKNQRI